MIVVRSFDEILAGVQAIAAIRLRTSRDATIGNESVLLVDYPARTTDPAARDVHCTTEARDWTGGRAIAFRVRPDQPTRLSVSFLDRNHVAWTAWLDLHAGEWQSVRIAFDTLRPNPFFQPPGADTSRPIDVSDNAAIGFAPQSPGAGRLAMSTIAVT
jgi:Carbohydrate binding domain (family 11)